MAKPSIEGLLVLKAIRTFEFAAKPREKGAAPGEHWREPGIYSYLQAAEHFGISKVTVGWDKRPMRLQTLLAYEMNLEPLNYLHGTPLRLRVENQPGFKMVK